MSHYISCIVIRVNPPKRYVLGQSALMHLGKKEDP
jgi:hypothetical protein